MAISFHCPTLKSIHLLPVHHLSIASFQNYKDSWSPKSQDSSVQNGRKSWVANSSSNKKPGSISFGERLLDYIEGGPKLRKWYGASDLLPRDGIVGDKEEDVGKEREQEDIPEVRDAVLVTDGDNETAQLVILSLIIKRARIKALVKDRKAAIAAFGNYIEPIAGDITDKASVKKALKGVRAIICTTKLAMFRRSGGIQAFMHGKAKRLAEEDEAAIIASGVPYTIVRTGLLQNKPRSQHGFSFKEGCSGNGTLSKEDAAAICVEALGAPPQEGLIFEVANGDVKVQNWKELFSSLTENGSQLQ